MPPSSPGALERAIALRRDWLGLDAVTDAYRLVHSEGDGLSGLVVDRFGSTLVLEFFAAGMYRFRSAIQEALAGHFPDSRFYWFAEEHVQKQESFDCRPPEPPPPGIITEHGLRFRVAPGSKHKTGFFLDQRDNRKALAGFCAGRRVLDLCCNTGGFAVYAKGSGRRRRGGGRRPGRASPRPGQAKRQPQPGARALCAGRPVPLAARRAGHGAALRRGGARPGQADARSREIDFALKRYLDMNRLALQAVAPGGVFLTCSCTGLVSEDTFLDTLRRAAWQAGRTLQVLRIAGAGADHPFLAARAGGALSQGGLLPGVVTGRSQRDSAGLVF